MLRLRLITYALLTVAILSLLLTACGGANSIESAGKGALQGNVTIGPIWPVEPPGGNPPIPPEVYESRKVMVYDENGISLIEQVDIIPHGDYGSYYVKLDAGRYAVDINRIGIDHSSDVPITIEIVSGRTVYLDIDIDTGIR
jgi:hypothetical protein